jgi:glycosyltransferase involved in cell wall biosynthesis
VGQTELRARYDLGESRVLLAFGFLTPDKGLDVLVEALALLAGRHALDGVRLVVAGSVRGRSGVFRLFELRDRRHVAAVRRRARDAGVDAMMTFTGYVASEEMATWFILADAAVLPYRRIEDSGVAAMAAAAGTPLIVSDAGELHLVYDSSSFAAGDPAALADALEAFLTRAQPPRGADGAGARTSLPAVAGETAQAYRRLLG